MKLSKSLLAAFCAGLWGQSLSQTIDPEIATGMDLLAHRVVDGVLNQQRLLPSNALLKASAQRVGGWFPEQRFELLLIDDPAPNAVALPSGQVMLNLGLSADLDSPTELEFVLAHEVAHLALNHFQRRLKDNSVGTRRALEQEADHLALDAMTRAGRSTASLASLLQRTGRTHVSLPEPMDSDPEPSPELGAELVQMQQSALALLLSHDELDRAEKLLQRREQVFDPSAVAHWRRLIEQRRKRQPVETQAVDFLLPGQIKERFPDHSGQCQDRKGSPQDSPYDGHTKQQTGIAAETAAVATEASASMNFGGLAGRRDRRWQLALQTGRQLVLSPDHSGLTRLDLWRLDTTPRGHKPHQLPCPNGRYALWHTLTEFRALDQSQKLDLAGAGQLASGVYLDLNMTDESGLPWRLRGWRLVHGSGQGQQVIFALYRAPAGHFFQRHLAAASAMVAGLRPRPMQ